MRTNAEAFDQILAALAVEVHEISFCELAAHNAIAIAPENVIEVHYVLAGTLHVHSPAGDAVVPAGGIVAVPPGVEHRVAADPRPARVFPSQQVLGPCANGMMTLDGAGEERAEVRVVCGHVRADLNGSFGPLQGMTTPLCAELGDDPIVAAAFATMLREVTSVELGGRALIAALMKACLLLALRHDAKRHGLRHSLPGLFDQPSLARAIAKVLDAPSAPYSLAGLARESGMSRSKFAKSFADLVGTTPMEFVARARLNRARELLLATELPIAEIAREAGFSSGSYFSRSFKAAFGTDPTTMRQQRGHA